jgi:hypothetical protein
MYSNSTTFSLSMRVRGPNIISGQETLRKNKYGSFASEKNGRWDLRIVWFFDLHNQHAIFGDTKRFA